ncbi:hypothetical protein VN12_04240 [Pirellula sp. SH-Sr6A]|nr:hypothetical protein VN12_02115 [Pirellula sp. SH-Sr6A]AMV31302.1 hypothetical protein VN12_04240 [Pirellula sp. SH-Sr6A]
MPNSKSLRHIQNFGSDGGKVHMKMLSSIKNPRKLKKRWKKLVTKSCLNNLGEQRQQFMSWRLRWNPPSGWIVSVVANRRQFDRMQKRLVSAA